MIAAFFAGRQGQGAREPQRAEVQAAVEMGGPDWRQRLAPAARARPHEHRPFHWELEFPEVFDARNGGFDAIVGNPPFAGKNTIIAGHPGATTSTWLQTLHEGAHGNADLVAHFFRRAFGLLRQGGAFGLIATNTIGQGDTRATGLGPILAAGGDDLPRAAADQMAGRGGGGGRRWCTSTKAPLAGPYLLDGRQVRADHGLSVRGRRGRDPARSPPTPARLSSALSSSAWASPSTTRTSPRARRPIAEMHRLIEKDPRNAERIFPYIGGEEVNTSPTHAHHRYVINFEDMSEDDGPRSWPDLMAIV